ncbi:MAG: hypothetical protein RLZZ381_1196 [Cyanobacteriota bacterium]|jgi:uncharacterized protein
MIEVFLDTSFAIALSSVTDQNHVLAVKLAEQIVKKLGKLHLTKLSKCDRSTPFIIYLH